MNGFLGLLVLSWPMTLMALIALAFVVAILITGGYAVRKGKSAWGWGLLGFLVVFLPIFWDWIPTVVMHKYYCDTEAGFWVYKTPEQWNKENPGVMETLVYYDGKKRNSVGDMNNYTDTSLINQRFVYIAKFNGPLLFNRWRHEEAIIDSKTNEVIAREINFSTSQERQQAGWNGWKFWLSSRQCKSYAHRDDGDLDPIVVQLEGQKK